VEIAFYSRELGGNNFPHAFVVLRGTVDATGEGGRYQPASPPIRSRPASCGGRYRAEVLVEGERQIARSDRQFALTLSDERYRAVMVVDRWRNMAQPSYNLNRATASISSPRLAAAAGLESSMCRADEEAAIFSASFAWP
jgi:hypothetical protein